MILTQQVFEQPGLDECWWSVHVPTLALIRNSGKGSELRMEYVKPIEGTVAIQSSPIPNREILAGRAKLTHAQANPPEWILLNDPETGTTPAIMHTADPVFIAFADPASAVLRAPEHFRSSVDLTVEGWTYWWEDAQRAFEKLTVESVAAFGIHVPEEIRNQA